MRKGSSISALPNYVVYTDIILGKGSTGRVYQGVDLTTKEKVAIKIIDKRTINNEVSSYLLNMEKKAIMSKKNKFVLEGLEVAEDKKYCYLVTELCNGGTLKKEIYNSINGYFSQQKAMKIFHSLLLGYQSLSQNQILHRDLKPANIMFHDNIPKIIDFGYSEIKGYQKPSLKYNVGSPSYMAPESFHNNLYSQKTQIWALGVILFEMLAGRTIDQGRHMSDVYHEIERQGVPYPSHVSFSSKTIIDWCLKKNPNHRPTCEELLQNFFNQRAKAKTTLESGSIKFGTFKDEPKKNIQKVVERSKVFSVVDNGLQTGYQQKNQKISKLDSIVDKLLSKKDLKINERKQKQNVTRTNKCQSNFQQFYLYKQPQISYHRVPKRNNYVIQEQTVRQQDNVSNKINWDYGKQQKLLKKPKNSNNLFEQSNNLQKQDRLWNSTRHQIKSLATSTHKPALQSKKMIKNCSYLQTALLAKEDPEKYNRFRTQLASEMYFA